MDPYTQKLMERTRERRELLAKKMEELSPSRKRTVLGDSQVQNFQATKVENNSPNKQHCVREEEQVIKPGTPAILRIKSRMKDIAVQREQWSNDSLNKHHCVSEEEQVVKPDTPAILSIKSHKKDIAVQREQWSNDSPNKHHCVREEEQVIKPDTPAIQSIKSRMKDIAMQREQWSDDSLNKHHCAREEEQVKQPNAPAILSTSTKSRMKDIAVQREQGSDDSPNKRHCVREEEQVIKPDTPAILSIKSRTRDIAVQREQWSNECERKDNEPTKTPVSARLANWQNMVDAERRERTSPQKKVPKLAVSPAKMPATASTPLQTSKSSLSKARVLESTPVPAPRQTPISEKARHFERNSPVRGSGISPKKLAPAARAIQEKLDKLQDNWQQNEIAEKIRQQKQADMAVLQNRWQNGILKDEDDADHQAPNAAGHKPEMAALPAGGVPPPPPPLPPTNCSPAKARPAATGNCGHLSPASKAVSSASKKGKHREDTRDKLRADFENKLAAMGFEVESTPDKKVATFDLRPLKEKEAAEQLVTKNSQSPSKKTTSTIPEKLDANLKPNTAKSPLKATINSTPTPRSATSIYSLIKKQTGATPLNSQSTPAATSKKEVFLATSTVSLKEPGRRNSFDSNSSYETEESQSETGLSRQASTASSQSGYSQSESQYSETQDEYTSQTDDASEYEDYTTEDPSTQSESGESDDGCSEISDLLDEALDDTTAMETESGPAPVPAPRRCLVRESSSRHRQRPATYHEKSAKMPSAADVCDIQPPEVSIRRPGTRAHVQADKRVTWAAEGALSSAESDVEEKAIIYSIDQYRAKRDHQDTPVPSQSIVRNTEHRNVGQPVQQQLSQKSIKQRLQELQEMVNQEQNIIMQTSNALNQCCHSASTFAASQEAVECHRLLLLACKKRECYLSEMSYLRDGGRQRQDQGPVGSLTISDIRLPLKQDVMSRLNANPGQTVHYFVLLVRHENHLISTQMVSTQDTLVRGALDIPNLIKFQDIHQSFHVQLDIYSMHITKEPLTQTPKKKKGLTPKKKKVPTATLR